MKKRIVICMSLILCGYFHLYAQTAQNINNNVLRLMSIIRYYHINAPKFDEDYSKIVYKEFLESLDPRNCYFDYQDILQLSEYKGKLFEGIDKPGWSFLNIVKSMYRKRLVEYDSVASEYLQKPLDLEISDSIVPQWNISAKYDRIGNARKYLKYRVLVSMFLTGDSVIQIDRKSETKVQETAVSRVLKNEGKKMDKLLNKPNALDGFVEDCFLNAIAQCADPHTEYFSPDKKKEFESTLKSETLSFGFYIRSTEDDEIFIANIVPGGPAWASKQFTRGDQIIAFRIPGKERVEISEIGVEEANEILTSDENRKVEFFLKNKEGVLKSTVLEKQKIDQDNVIVKGFFLNGKVKIGYISLPEFYYGAENQYLGCAYDVSKTLEEFKNEGIRGLIMDLRGNGGGSIRESVNLSGLFINHGPVCRIMEKQNGISTLKDKIKGIDYRGPMVVMVNQMSASAAEIFASAMQDYHRAVIVGSQTYGKATGQAIIPFGFSGRKPDPDQGFAKVTTLKLFRINGESNQKTGITPDISMPDFFKSMQDYKESSEPYALANTRIGKSIHRRLPALPLKILQEEYNKRMENDSVFKAIHILTDSISQHLDPERPIPLDINNFRLYFAQKSRLSNEIEQLPTGNRNIFKVIPLSRFDQEDTVKSDYMNDQVKDIQTDVYVQETYLVLKDLIEYQQNK